MGLNCLNIKRACIRIFLLIFLWWLDCQRFITASLLTFFRKYIFRHAVALCK
ncbi:peptidyl-dipeptidase dcp [Salmonella enterica subsp. enterica]|nr:peptidyl-dipeptidase dcp [Salmonella enterica subsp. enterica serovar Sandiego]